jgi:hypothetical protein
MEDVYSFFTRIAAWCAARALRTTFLPVMTEGPLTHI